MQSAVHTVASEEEGQDGEGSTLQTVDLRRLDEDSRAELEPVLREEVAPSKPTSTEGKLPTTLRQALRLVSRKSTTSIYIQKLKKIYI